MNINETCNLPTSETKAESEQKKKNSWGAGKTHAKKSSCVCLLFFFLFLPEENGKTTVWQNKKKKRGKNKHHNAKGKRHGARFEGERRDNSKERKAVAGVDQYDALLSQSCCLSFIRQGRPC